MRLRTGWAAKPRHTQPEEDERMSFITVGLIVFSACVFGGAMLGMLLVRFPNHRSAKSIREVGDGNRRPLSLVWACSIGQRVLATCKNDTDGGQPQLCWTESSPSCSSGDKAARAHVAASCCPGPRSVEQMQHFAFEIPVLQATRPLREDGRIMPQNEQQRLTAAPSRAHGVTIHENALAHVRAVRRVRFPSVLVM